MLTGPVDYLTHEGAHYLVARAFVTHPKMHFDRIELPASTDASHRQRTYCLLPPVPPRTGQLASLHWYSSLAASSLRSVYGRSNSYMAYLGSTSLSLAFRETSLVRMKR
jgi:hypothetical protein